MEARPKTTSSAAIERAVDDRRLRHDADAKAGQVVIARGVEVGQDGRFAAEQAQSACRQPSVIALDKLFEQLRIVLGHGHVVEEEQRLGAAAEGVVDAHRHQVDADRRMNADRDGHPELGSHAVGAGDQHRVFVLLCEQVVGEIELEQAGESPFEGEHAGRVGAPSSLGNRAIDWR